MRRFLAGGSGRSHVGPSDGKHLEMRVAKLYKRLGKKNVKLNQILVDSSGNRSEIDVTYGRIFKRYIECKDYKDNVPLEMVAKFKAVLELNHIPLSHGIFITTSDYTPRAREIGIRTINGVELKRLEKYAQRRAYFLLTLKAFLLLGIAVAVYAYNEYPDQFAHYMMPLKKYEPLAISYLAAFQKEMRQLLTKLQNWRQL